MLLMLFVCRKLCVCFGSVSLVMLLIGWIWCVSMYVLVLSVWLNGLFVIVFVMR